MNRKTIYSNQNKLREQLLQEDDLDMAKIKIKKTAGVSEKMKECVAWVTWKIL